MPGRDVIFCNTLDLRYVMLDASERSAIRGTVGVSRFCIDPIPLSGR